MKRHSAVALLLVACVQAVLAALDAQVWPAGLAVGMTAVALWLERSTGLRRTPFHSPGTNRIRPLRPHRSNRVVARPYRDPARWVRDVTPVDALQSRDH